MGLAETEMAKIIDILLDDTYGKLKTSDLTISRVYISALVVLVIVTCLIPHC